MPVLSISVHYAGEQSPGTKPAEDMLEDNMLVQQNESALSRDVVNNEQMMLESDHGPQVCDYQLNKRCGEDIMESDLDLSRLINQQSNGIHFIDDPSTTGESHQTHKGDGELRHKDEENVNFLEAASRQMVECNTSNGYLEPKVSLSNEVPCKQSSENYQNAESHSLFCLQCNKKGNCPEHKEGEELLETACSLSENVLDRKDSDFDGLSKSNNVVDADVQNNVIPIAKLDSQRQDEQEHKTIINTLDLAFGTNIEQGSVSTEEHKDEIFPNSVNLEEIAEHCDMHDQSQNEEPDPPGTEYVEEHTVPLWVKWRGKWQTGFQCPRMDCPLLTLRAKPTHDRKNYIVIFFPRTRTYSWADVLLVRPINEFPEPLASGTHRRWRKLVKDLATPRRFIMQKLAVAMLNISDQLHVQAVAEHARRATTWTDFAMEASHCRDYPELGRMLLKLQTMILPSYVSSDWLENCLNSWMQRCESVQSADSIQLLTEELVASVQWNTVDALWKASVQPELGPEWKSWKQEAMKWFSTSNPVASVADTVERNSDISSVMDSQTSGKRLKLEVRRAENSSSQLGIQSKINQVELLPNASIGVDSSKSGGIMSSTVVMPADGRTGVLAVANVPYQYRQCSAFIAVKGRQCGRWASDGEDYCCVHLNNHSGGKLPVQEQRPPPDSPMCGGMTIHGDKCKHRARLGSSFCKKHGKMDDLFSPCGNTLKRKFHDNGVTENISSLSTSNGNMLGCADFGERSFFKMNESALYSAVPTPDRVPIPDLQHCIGFYGQANGDKCPEDAKKHTLYCEKHLPKFLKRARDGKSRMVSKDVFVDLLKSCVSRKEKLYLHQACELLYGFMKNSLSRQKPVSEGDITGWILTEASKDVNVGQFLLKLVSGEKERIMRLWGFGTSDENQTYTTQPDVLSTQHKHIKKHDTGEFVKCKICTREFPDDRSLGSHWTESHKKEARWLFRGYACAVCIDSFTNRKVLESHIKERHGEQFLQHSLLFRCMSCSSHFVNQEQLWQHVLSSHLAEFKMADHNLDQLSEATTVSGALVCQDNSYSGKAGFRRYVCKLCNMKFDLLPDLGRHHQVAHTNPSSISQLLPKRRNHFINHNRTGYPRFKKTFGAAYRFKSQTNFGMQKQFQPSNSSFSLRPKLTNQMSETVVLGKLLESHCSDVADTLFAEIQKTKPRPSNSEILSIGRSTCCRTNLHAALEEKYGTLPDNLYLKAAKLCSELNIEISWHLEGFICPKGCRPYMSTNSVESVSSGSGGCLDHPSFSAEFVSDTKWDMEECHIILNPKDFNWKPIQKLTILCKDVSFGKEPVPVACVIDADLDESSNSDLAETSYCQTTVMPWQGITYVTERLIEPSLGLDTKNSNLGCACQDAECSPEKCEHVYLFDNDYENAGDIYRKSMHGRFPYDERGRIVLEEGYPVYECSTLCKCQATCNNRVLQKGIQIKLEIFRTKNKGWAVRTVEAIARGTFVCEYVGELLTNVEANRRRERYNSSGCSYLYDIDANIDGAKGSTEGMVPYALDATRYGNVSRFINHSCSPNLVKYLVLVESMDNQLAHVGFYASRDIAAGEELAYDYRNKLRPGGRVCHCGAPNCSQLY